MIVTRHRLAVAFLLSAAAAPLAQAHAQAAGCAGSDAGSLTLGTTARVDPGAARSFAVTLAAGQGVIVDLSSLTPAATPTSDAADDDGDEHGHGEGSGTKAAPLRDLALCDARGTRLIPLAGEVFAKGGSVSAIPDGQRLRFVAPTAGRYKIGVTPSAEAREILVRERLLGHSSGGVAPTGLGKVEEGKVSSSAPQVFSFAAPAGQWVELKSTSENDTVLHLAGPDRKGEYSEIASNDDSEGLNPVIRRKLPMAGTYYLQVDSLGDETKDFTLTLKAIKAPPPPSPPARLSAGATVRDKLSGENDARLYALPVVAGHSYRLELTATYDGVVAIGLPNPVEADDGDNGSGAGFSEVKAQDSGTTGTERLTFTARSTGQLLVRIKSFGIGETDGSYTLVTADLGG
ncbi:MAG: PPC domain-containing protein [Novosphingobium sp.]